VYKVPFKMFTISHFQLKHSMK